MKYLALLFIAVGFYGCSPDDGEVAGPGDDVVYDYSLIDIIIKIRIEIKMNTRIRIKVMMKIRIKMEIRIRIILTILRIIAYFLQKNPYPLMNMKDLLKNIMLFLDNILMIIMQALFRYVELKVKNI